MPRLGGRHSDGVFERLCREVRGAQGRSRDAFAASVDPNRMCVRGLVARILLGLRMQCGRLGVQRLMWGVGFKVQLAGHRAERCAVVSARSEAIPRLGG